MKKLLWLAIAGLVIVGATFLGYQHGLQKGREDAKLWEYPPRANDLLSCAAQHLRGYDVEITQPKNGWGESTLRVLDGGQEVLRWEGHTETVFTRSGDILYLADYSPIATGCSIVAYDLGERKQLWKTKLRGIGPVGHSKYRNVVDLDWEDDVLVIRGRESYGQYIERVDARTGKTLSNQTLAGLGELSLWDKLRGSLP